ncbi:MAG: hypothetical protein H3C69_09390 [Candidatus Promineofilum sp.]|nr:hypothetical protein [Promineifilum sp.]
MKRFALLFVLFALLLPVYFAGAAKNVSVEPQRLSTKANANEYLIGLLPPQGHVDIDKNLRDASPRQLRAAVAGRQAEPLLRELRQLQARGEILGFVLDPDQYAIRVWANGALPALRGEAAMIAPAEQGLPSCAEGLAGAVADMARASLMAEIAPIRHSPSATDSPVIYVEASPPYYNKPSAIYGFAAPNSEITITVDRNGSSYVSFYEVVPSNGIYYVHSEWANCPRRGYTWYIQPGDVVRVWDSNGVSRMTVPPLVGTFDPITMTVEGQTSPHRRVSFSIFYLTDDNRWQSTKSQIMESDANGRFRTNVSHDAGSFSRRSKIIFSAGDGNRNVLTYSTPVFSVGVNPSGNNIWGWVNRGVPGTVDLIRGGDTIAQNTFISDETGHFDIYFEGASFLPGDALTVNDGRQTISIVVSPMDLELDATTGKINITATPGHRADFYTRGQPYSGILQTSCGYRGGQGTLLLGASGTANISTRGILPGDTAYFYLYDQEGNVQYSPTFAAPTIVAGPGSYGVGGYWHKAYVTLDVRLYDSADTLKSAITSDANHTGEFYDWFDVPVVSGDRITVSQGGQARTMVVPEVSGRLNSVAQNLTVAGPDRPYLATYDEYWGFHHFSSDCYEKAISGGSSVIDLSGRVSPGDSATIYIRGQDDNYTTLYLEAFKVHVGQDTNSVRVQAETPNGRFKLLHKRGDTVLSDQILTPEPSGYIFFTLPETVRAGDYLKIEGLESEAGLSAEMTLQSLTYYIEPSGYTVQGNLTPDYRIKIWVARVTNAVRWWSDRWTYSDENGHFSLDVLFPYLGGDGQLPCVLMSIHDPCVTLVLTYLTPDDHEVETPYKPPSPAPADEFENDDTATAAKPYEGGTQTHTFHTTTDVDWVKVDIPSRAVGRPVRFVVSNMGWDVAVDMKLYRPNGTTRITNATLEDLDGVTWLVWTPDQAGTFYLRVSPLFDDAGGHCDSFYDLRVDFARVSLPVVIR